MAASLKYKEVLKLLRASGAYKEFVSKGKGGHRMVCKLDDDGNKIGCCPIPYHGSKSLSIGVLKSITRKFELPADFFDSKKPKS